MEKKGQGGRIFEGKVNLEKELRIGWGVVKGKGRAGASRMQQQQQQQKRMFVEVSSPRHNGYAVL